MLRRLISAAGIAAVCGVAAAPAGAMTVNLGTPALSSRIAVTEPVTVSCSPFDPGLVVYGQGVNVSVEQASGRSIATGSGNGYTAFPCDGTQTTIPVTVLADPSGPPFHGGSAVISASAQASAGTPCGFEPGCYFPPFEFQSAGAGPITLNLH